MPSTNRAKNTDKPFLLFGDPKSAPDPLPEPLARSLVDLALKDWIVSPSRSILKGISKRPEPGEQIFDTHLDQTRFLLALKKNLENLKKIGEKAGEDCKNIPSLPRLHAVFSNGKRLQVAQDAMALTTETPCDPTVQLAINTLQSYAEHSRPSAKIQAKPLYRGLRNRDISTGHLPPIDSIFDAFSDALKEKVHATDPRYPLRQLAGHIIRYMVRHHALTHIPLAQICQGPLLSFTNSRRIAEVFTGNEGLIVETTNWPTPPDIITCSETEPRLKEKDPVSKKRENLSIVRVGKDFIVSPNDITPADFDYFHAIGDCRAIPSLTSTYIKIVYELNKQHITKSVSFVSETKRQAFYRIGDNFSLGEREFARSYGFSPKITAKNIAETKIVSIYRQDPFSSKKEPRMPLPAQTVSQLKKETTNILNEFTRAD